MKRFVIDIMLLLAYCNFLSYFDSFEISILLQPMKDYIFLISLYLFIDYEELGCTL
jgi:hypothetical protein